MSEQRTVTGLVGCPKLNVVAKDKQIASCRSDTSLLGHLAYIKTRPSLCSRMYRFVGNISLTPDPSLLKVGCSVPLPSDLLQERNVCSQLRPGKGCSHLCGQSSHKIKILGFSALHLFLYSSESAARWFLFTKRYQGKSGMFVKCMCFVQPQQR